jgi:alkylation response protein AidB-like acyl-CoA dehydrogenase
MWPRQHLGRLDASLSSARIVVQELARQVDSGEVPPEEIEKMTARALVTVKECIGEVAIGALHLAGAHGYATASPLNRLIRDALGFNAVIWRIDEVSMWLGGGVFGETVLLPGFTGS